MGAPVSEETQRKGFRGGPNRSVEGRAIREEDLDALFRELDEEPAAALVERKRRARGTAGRAFMAAGVVLIVGGFLAALLVRSPGAFLSVVLAVNVAAVLCVAVGVLLLPEKAAPARPPKS